MTNLDFIKIKRTRQQELSPEVRIKDHLEFKSTYDNGALLDQSKRCMDCGTPFCHSACPLGNLIPEWNELTALGINKKAWERLEETNNFPEITGRICPAPCESDCTLGLIEEPVSIKGIEHTLSEIAFQNGWIKAKPPKVETGKKIAVIGSGPCGLSAAQQLRRKGHNVTIYDKNKTPGGLLTYGIPAFKLSKDVIKRRISQLLAEGVVFKNEVEIGKDVNIDQLKTDYDAVLVAVGANKPRALKLENYNSDNILNNSDQIVGAEDFLKNQIEVILCEEKRLSTHAKNKNVIVIGGGDTGADCVGTSIRQGAFSVTQIEIHEQPAQIKSSSSHMEGCDRVWGTKTLRIRKNEEGLTSGVDTIKVYWDPNKGFVERHGTEKTYPADLILFAIGYDGFNRSLFHSSSFDNEYKEGKYLSTDKNFKLSAQNVFVAGDVRTGPSLVVNAINEGRKVAEEISKFVSHP